MTAGPVILAIETSQRDGGVALRDAGGATRIEPLARGGRHDDDLLPAVDRLLARHGLAPRDLDAVGVCVGPGGFTGLRIAVATAKMLGEALGARLVAVPGALVAATATDVDDDGGARTVIVALASKGDSWWATAVRRDATGWHVAGTPGLATVETFAPDAATIVLADAHFPDAARTRCADAGATIIAPVFAAAACLDVAARHLAEGATATPETLAPLYPREPEAVTLWAQRKRPPA